MAGRASVMGFEGEDGEDGEKGEDGGMIRMERKGRKGRMRGKESSSLCPNEPLGRMRSTKSI